MTVSELHTTEAAMISQIVSGLGDLGYVFHPKTSTLDQFLLVAADAIGSPTFTVLSKTRAQILNVIIDALAGTQPTPPTIAALHAACINALGGGGGGGGGGLRIQIDDGSGTWLFDDGSTMIWDGPDVAPGAHMLTDDLSGNWLWDGGAVIDWG